MSTLKYFISKNALQDYIEELENARRYLAKVTAKNGHIGERNYREGWERFNTIIQKLENMSTKNLIIEPEQAKRLYTNASKEFKEALETTFGKSSFISEITDKIQNWNDISDLVGGHGEDIMNGYPLTREKRQLVATAKLFKIAKAYNQGKVVTITDAKYFPHKHPSGRVGGVPTVGWYSGLCVPLGLCFISPEYAMNAYNKFIDVFNDYWMINN